MWGNPLVFQTSLLDSGSNQQGITEVMLRWKCVQVVLSLGFVQLNKTRIAKALLYCSSACVRVCVFVRLCVRACQWAGPNLSTPLLETQLLNFSFSCCLQVLFAILNTKAPAEAGNYRAVTQLGLHIRSFTRTNLKK